MQDEPTSFEWTVVTNGFLQMLESVPSSFLSFTDKKDIVAQHLNLRVTAPHKHAQKVPTRDEDDTRGPKVLTREQRDTSMPKTVDKRQPCRP